MPGIGIIVNPKGKEYKNNPDKVQRLSFIVGDRGSYGATEDLHDLRRVAEQFKTRDIDILGIGGGDGTMHVALSHFIDVYGEKPLPKIALLRGGTMNILATACKIKGEPEKILSNLIYKYHEGQNFETIEVDLMQINHHYGFIFGCGVVYRFMQAYYEGTPPSPFKAFYTLTRSISSAIFNTPFTQKMFERFDGEIWVDGQKWPFENWSSIFTGTVPEVGLGFNIFYQAQAHRKFHITAFSMPARNLLRHVPKMSGGKAISCPEILCSGAETVKIELAEPIHYTIDGDMMQPEKNFSIKTGPRLTILVK